MPLHSLGLPPYESVRIEDLTGLHQDHAQNQERHGRVASTGFDVLRIDCKQNDHQTDTTQKSELARTAPPHGAGRASFCTDKPTFQFAGTRATLDGLYRLLFRIL